MLGFGVAVLEDVDVKEGEKSKWFDLTRVMRKF